MSKRRRNPRGDEGVSALRRRYAQEPTTAHFVALHQALRRTDPAEATELVREWVRPVLADGALYVQRMTELEELGLAGELLNEELVGHGPIYRYGHRSSEPISTPEHSEVSWGELEALPRYDASPRPWYLTVPAGMSGGDYGDFRNRVNHDVFMREHGDKPGVFGLYGGHGSYGVAIRLDCFDEEVMETLNRLQNHLILDEDAHSQAEYEAQGEAWENRGGRERGEGDVTRRNPGDQDFRELQRRALRDPQAMQQLLTFGLRRDMIDENAIGALVAMGLEAASACGRHTRIYSGVPHYSQAFSYYREPATLFNHPFESSLMLCRAARNVVVSRINVNMDSYEIETRNTRKITALERRAVELLAQIEAAVSPGGSETRRAVYTRDQATVFMNTAVVVRELEPDLPDERAKGLDGRWVDLYGSELDRLPLVAEGVASLAGMIYTLDQGFVRQGDYTLRSADADLYATITRDFDVLLAIAAELGPRDPTSWSTGDYESFHASLWDGMPEWFLRRFGLLPQRP